MSKFRKGYGMRLLLVEDEEELVSALARGLRREGYAVDVALDGQAGWEMADVNEYDLVLLDLNLPQMDGIEVCRRLKQSQPQVLILMLTARDLPTQKIAGLDVGADDYMVKPFHFGELCARLRALLRRDMRVRGTLLSYGDLKLDPMAKIAWKGEQRLELTNKEFGILEYLLYHAGEVISQEKLIEHVWDANANPFTTTVRVHINSLRRKLADDPEHPLYIETIVGVGYRLLEYSSGSSA